MERNISSPELKSDLKSKSLIDYIISLEETLNIQEGIIYYDFPLFRDYEDTLYRSKILLLSKNYGVQIIKISSSNLKVGVDEVYEIDEQISQLYSIIKSKLIKSKLLRKTRDELKFPLNCFIIFDEVYDKDLLQGLDIESDILPIRTKLKDRLEEQIIEPLDGETFKELRSIIEGAKGMARPTPRIIPEKHKQHKVALLAELESEIANFDEAQRNAALSIVDGPQRIRGLAGSGKTIVLAMKAAHLHLQYPEAEILYTFYTKSLYGFIKRQITRFYRQFNDKDPDWKKINILHAWGGRNYPGVYYKSCLENGITPLTLSDAKSKGSDPFAYVCDDLLRHKNIKQSYDYILMDEAQDFPNSFYKLCFKIAKGGKFDRNIIWAYDELQNIMNVKVLTPKTAFGTNAKGEALIDLERASENTPFGISHDVVLRKCYRNPREILICAHALGFGLYRKPIVQTLENKDHWIDVGYEFEKGNCVPGEETIIVRPEKNSPLSISKNQNIDDLIEFKVFDSFDEEIKWACDQTSYFLSQGLSPRDILIISLDDRNARSYFKRIEKNLIRYDVHVNDILNLPFGPSPFFKENCITLSTVYRAKGNEAPVVIAVGIDALHSERNTQSGRNKIFTAFTRSKAWLRVSGIGNGAEFFKNEIDAAKSNSPKMKFEYPDPQEIITLQRDLSDKASKIQRIKDKLQLDFEDLDLEEEDVKELIESFLVKK